MRIHSVLVPNSLEERSRAPPLKGIPPRSPPSEKDHRPVGDATVAESPSLGAYDALRGTGTCIRYEPLVYPGPHNHERDRSSAERHASLRDLLVGVSEDHFDGRPSE